MKKMTELLDWHHRHELSKAYPEVAALQPKICRTCGLQKLVIDFNHNSKVCKVCRHEYAEKKKIKYPATKSFRDFHVRTQKDQEWP